MKKKPAGDGKPQDPPKPFVSNFCIAVHIRGEFSTDDLHRALDGIRPRHKLLVPQAESGDPERAHIPLRELEECGELDWVEVVKEELRTPFPGEQGPFARFTLLRRKERSDLVGAFNHGVCDGFSGVYVMRDVLRLLGEPGLTLPPLPLPPPVAGLLPPSVAENPRLRRRVGRMIRGLHFARSLRRLRTRLFPHSARKLPARPEPAGGQPASQRFCILTHTLTAAQTAALVKRCRMEETSVHAAVCTAWLLAYTARLEGRKTWRRWVSSPVSLRSRMARPVDETVGMFLSTVETPLDCRPRRGFWQAARRFKEDLRRASTDEKVFLMPLLFNSLFSSLPPEEVGEMAGVLFDRPVRYDFSITNLGRLDIPLRIGALEIEGFHNLVNSSEHERTVGVNTLGDQMTLTFMLRESNMEPGRAKQLMEKAIEELAQASGW